MGHLDAQGLQTNTDVTSSQLHVREHITGSTLLHFFVPQLSTGNNIVDLSLYLSSTEFHRVLNYHKHHLKHVMLFLYFTDKETEGQDVKNLIACECQRGD